MGNIHHFLTHTNFINVILNINFEKNKNSLEKPRNLLVMDGMMIYRPM